MDQSFISNLILVSLIVYDFFKHQILFQKSIIYHFLYKSLISNLILVSLIVYDFFKHQILFQKSIIYHCFYKLFLTQN